MEEIASPNLLSKLLIDETGVTLTALAEKLQLTHNGRLVAVVGSSCGQTLKLVEDKPFLCILCGECFTHTTSLRDHAQKEHSYREDNAERTQEGHETDIGAYIAGRHQQGTTESGVETYTVKGDETEERTQCTTDSNDTNDGDDDTDAVCNEVHPKRKARNERRAQSDGEVEADDDAAVFAECKVCSKKFASEAKLLEHEIRHCGKEMHKCSACRVAYSGNVNTSQTRTQSDNVLNESRGNVHYLFTGFNPPGMADGYTQGMGVVSAQSMARSEEEESDQLLDGEGIDCVLCGETFGILQHMIAHSHTYSTFPCTFCEKEFRSMRDLGWHCKHKHDLLLVRCPFCNRGFREYSHLVFHIREHKGHLKCKVCKVQCLSRSSFEAHKELHSNSDENTSACEKDVTGQGGELNSTEGEEDEPKEKEKQVCHICSKPLNTFYSLFHHLRREHPTEPLPAYNSDLAQRRFVCQQCGFAFRRKDTLERHEEVHKRGDYPRRKPAPRPLVMPRPGNLLCKICGRAFLRGANLEAHMEQAHPEHCDEAVKNKKKYCCDLCGKLLMSQKSLDRHVLVHQEPQFPCPICNKKLKHQETLKTHMRTHTGERPYACNICHQAFAQRSSYVQHMCIHTGERPYQCEICNKKFIRKTELKMHQAKHSNIRLFPCNYCSKTFKTEKHRKVHEMQLHSARAHMYMCEKCGKSFTWPSGLKAHACSHIGEAPYKCEECNKAFSQPLFLKRHMHVHTRPFKCEHCYEGFKNKLDLKNHLAQIHGIVPDQAWKPKLVEAELGPPAPVAMPGPGPSQHHYMPDPMVHDRTMFVDTSYQVQDSTNQAIAAMLTQMSTL